MSNRFVVAVCLLILFLTLFYNYLPLPFRHHGKVLEWEYYSIITLSLPILFIFSKRIKFDRMIGELSYPIYITHALILGTLGRFNFLINTNINKMVSIAIIVIVAILINKYIANPIEKYRQARVKITEDKRGELK